MFISHAPRHAGTLNVTSDCVNGITTPRSVCASVCVCVRETGKAGECVLVAPPCGARGGKEGPHSCRWIEGALSSALAIL